HKIIPISSGNYLEVYKDIGYPLEVAHSTGLVTNDSNTIVTKLKNLFGYSKKEKMGDLWLAHTRQPTNSPGSSAIWSHPFSFFNTAIVHNGDISSFGANINFLNSRGIPNLVGTDSEVVSFIIDYLVRVMKLSMEEIGLILSNPYDRFLYRMGKDKSKKIRDLLYKYQGSQLDGPFTILAGYSDGEDVYLLSIIDRSKFRPIVIGEDQNYIYMASEECQIRLLSPNSIIWTPEPGKFVLASMNHGIIESGRTSEIIVNSASKNELIQIQKITHSSKNMINAVDLSSYELNRQIKIKLSDNEKSITLLNVRGQRYLGVDLPKGTKLHIYGTPGNCLANFNKGTEICVYGSAEDNVADTMYEGKIIIHGDSRDVIGYALQGGKIFVKGNVGNRAFILMREYEESRPVVIVGGRADDYFGEYMAGGLAMVLGIDYIDSANDEQLVGNFLATGMLRGSIYIRGKINSDSIGLKPPMEDIIRYLEYLNSRGIITDDLFKKISSSSDINLEILQE
ncbi:MAG TPA: glutamate synthase, partial [Nitrososphaerales archaeon]|nr:glutamate synthase [Nitrososphaerales archaeon]